jgi:hypothetical protein
LQLAKPNTQVHTQNSPLLQLQLLNRQVALQEHGVLACNTFTATGETSAASPSSTPASAETSRRWRMT